MGRRSQKIKKPYLTSDNAKVEEIEEVDSKGKKIKIVRKINADGSTEEEQHDAVTGETKVIKKVKD